MTQRLNWPDGAVCYAAGGFWKSIGGGNMIETNTPAPPRHGVADTLKLADDYQERPVVTSGDERPYSKYFRDVSHLEEMDVYAVHSVFGVDDPSGAIQHASKKLLLSGSRTGGKSKYQDIKEAHDTLTRWLELFAD